MKFYLHQYGRVFRFLFPYYQWRVKTKEKEIYITFDDGPVPEVTEFALDELAKYNGKATFFCVGENIHKHPEVYKRLVEEGHTVGNHTYNHLNARKVKSDAYVQNMKKCDEVIQSNKKLFRPPYARLKFEHIRELKKWGYKIIMWDVLTGDFDQKLDWEKALQESISATRSGSVILMHDNPKHFHNMKEILPRFLKHFAQQGYTFKAL